MDRSPLQFLLPPTHALLTTTITSSAFKNTLHKHAHSILGARITASAILLREPDGLDVVQKRPADEQVDLVRITCVRAAGRLKDGEGPGVDQPVGAADDQVELDDAQVLRREAEQRGEVVLGRVGRLDAGGVDGGVSEVQIGEERGGDEGGEDGCVCEGEDGEWGVGAVWGYYQRDGRWMKAGKGESVKGRGYFVARFGDHGGGGGNILAVKLCFWMEENVLALILVEILVDASVDCLDARSRFGC